LNFLFDFMRPWHLSYETLKSNVHYIECDTVFIHCPEWGHFDWRDLPRICQEKNVIMILWDWIASGNDPDNYFFRKTNKSFTKRMNILHDLPIIYVAVSERSAKKWRDFCNLANIHTIYNGINIAKIYPIDKSESRKALWLPLDKKIILSIAWSGSKSSLKGIHYVEKIVDHYKNDDWYLFLSLGNWQEHKTNTYRELWLIPYEKISLFFSAADCFLYPTLADNCPLVILEWFACGCPVVTFEIWWVPEIVKHKQDGYIAQYKKLDDLLVWFKRVLAQGERIKPILDPKFSDESMIDWYEKLYKSLVS